MALQFMDGFDAQDLDKKWTAVATTWQSSLLPVTGRFGVGSAISQVSNTSAVVLARKSFTASAKVIVGFAYKYTVATDGADIIRLFGDNNATQHLSLRILTSGAIVVARGTTVIATSAASGLVNPNTWAYIEMSATISDTVGAVEVRVNGATALTFTGDTKNAGTATTLDSFVLWYGSTGTVPVYDDVYICDGTGSVNNDFLGDVRVQMLKPNAAGFKSDLTPVGSSNHWANVDEVPPDAADYNYSTTAGHQDLYGLEDVLAGTTAVKAVQVNAVVRKTDSGSRSAKTLIRSGSTTTAGASTPLSSTSAVLATPYDVNPTTTSAWAVTDMTALEAGIEVV